MRIRILTITVLLFSSLAACSADILPPIEFPDEPQSGNSTGGSNGGEVDAIIANPNFEETVDLTKHSGQIEPGRWYYVGGWYDSAAKVRQLDGWGYKDSRCLSITASERTVDVGIAQRIKVTPGKYYRISAKIKTIGVSGANTESGAHLSINSIGGKKSRRVHGNTDWTTVSLDIEPENEYIEIALKLGANCDDARGEAYFDNITISYNDDISIHESEHFILITEKKLIPTSDDVVKGWLAKLDKIYDAYVELFSGRKPYNGNKIKIRSDEINAWAYAGNPIQWNQNYIAETMMTVAKGDWCFGIMHEIGHDFAPGNFNEFSATYAFDFNEEVFANWRMYYAIEKCNPTIITNGKTYIGKDIIGLYKSDTSNCYDKILAQHRSEEMGNALTYCLWRIREKYGWDVWINTWDEIYRIPRNEIKESEMNQWEKFDYLMTMLSRHTPNGEDVRETFPSGELDVIKAYLSTQK